jgi:hypothetical protein
MCAAWTDFDLGRPLIEKCRLANQPAENLGLTSLWAGIGSLRRFQLNSCCTEPELSNNNDPNPGIRFMDRTELQYLLHIQWPNAASNYEFFSMPLCVLGKDIGDVRIVQNGVGTAGNEQTRFVVCLGCVNELFHGSSSSKVADRIASDQPR